jgi:putative endonuclease
MKQGFVYIMANRKNGTLYVGMTSNLLRRDFEHKNNILKGFTKKHGVHRLVYYEVHDSIEAAISREKHIKKWNRAWKIELVEKFNPTWKDLSVSLAA